MDRPGIHGIVLVPEFGRGLTSNGGDGTVTAFDIKTLKATSKLKSCGVPDVILHHSVSRRVFTYNHKTDDASVIDAVSGSVVGPIAFDSEPEAAVAAGAI